MPIKLKECIETITKQVYECITNPPQGSANITQWCKQDNCWIAVKELNSNVTLDDLLIDKEEHSYIQKESQTRKKINFWDSDSKALSLN